MTEPISISIDAEGRKGEGFCTPLGDKVPQKMHLIPKKVIPIIFLPGIMGSNLRLKPQRQNSLKKKNNIAWRPDFKMDALDIISVTPAYRQLLLDQDTTEVDTYDDGEGPTGTLTESSNDRHKVDSVGFSLPDSATSPLLTDDPSTRSPRRTKEDKARARGWQEIMYSSYQKILELCEFNLNKPLLDGIWSDVVGRSPTEWQALDNPEQKPLTIKEVKECLAGIFFPMHAMGYNWLQSNYVSGKVVAGRIESLIADYVRKGYICEKVILVTHSMGGLVARAVIHPEMGNALDKVLGIVHGVMPSHGAPAAYRRMRCGFEEGLVGWKPAPKVLGNLGTEVTAVLGNAPGGLELLPSCAYGNGWLELRQPKGVILKLPMRGDPYEEIYKLRDEWYRLINSGWLNPANRSNVSVDRTFAYLDKARDFHIKIADTFHPISFAHYCDDESAFMGKCNLASWGAANLSGIPKSQNSRR